MQGGEDVQFPDHAFVAALEGLLGLLQATVHHLQIRHDQFQIDDLDVAYRIGAALNVGDVGIVEAAHDVNDGVRGTNIGQELVSQALAVAGTFYQTRDVHELDDSRGELFRVIEVTQPFQPLIRYRYDSDVRVDGAECVVVGGNTGVGDGVEQSGLAHIRESDDSEFHMLHLLVSGVS